MNMLIYGKGIYSFFRYTGQFIFMIHLSHKTTALSVDDIFYTHLGLEVRQLFK
jgi:hypothetical protein